MTKAEQPTITLLSCPFCGGEPSVSSYETESLWSHNQVTYTKVYCGECDVGFDAEEGMIPAQDAWNTRTTSLAAQDWRKRTALLQVKAFVDEMIEGQYNCSPHQYFMAAQGRAIDLKPVIDAAVATDPAPSLAAQDGLVDALRFYAEEDRYDYDQTCCTYAATKKRRRELEKSGGWVLEDGGEKARAALASIEVKS